MKYLISFLPVNKTLNISLFRKIIQNWPLCILLPKYKRCFDKIKDTYFMIEEEKVFDKYMEIWKKIAI